MTRVVSMREWVKADPNHVYIGRAGHGESGIYGNPVAKGRRCPECGDVHVDGGSTLACYEAYLNRRLATDTVFRNQVRALAGKTLVCFCKPKPCHGDVLAAAADRLAQEPK